VFWLSSRGEAEHAACDKGGCQLSFVKSSSPTCPQELWLHRDAAVVGGGRSWRGSELAVYPASAVKLAVPADGSCPKGRFVAGGVEVRHLDLDRAGVFMTGMSAVVDGAPSWVA
jgi:hypothetical protein